MKKLICLSTTYMLLFLISPVAAEGFDEQAAKDLVSKYTTPITNFLLWVVPVATVIVCIANYVTWAMKDERERENSPWSKQIKSVIIGAIVVMSISAILKIFGIA